MYTTVMPTTPPTVRFGPRGPVSNGQHWPGQQHRPLISSPLSSPPHSTATIPTTFDSSPPARWQQDQNQQNQVFRASQSSPIQPPPAPSLFGGSEPHNSASRFRFATRPARLNPLLKRREDAQESRRRLFLQNVRQRAEDKRWEMRGGEEELLKLEWQRLNRERLLAAQAEASAYIIDDPDAVDAELEALQRERQFLQQQNPQGEDVDAMMADDILRQEEAEVDELVSAIWEGQQDSNPSQFSDDDADYDMLFMEMLVQEEQRLRQGGSSQDVEML